MKKTYLFLAALALLCLAVVAQANITIDTVTVGDAGNAADTTGYGSVAYSYNVGKYEVTAGQYTAFLNAKAATDTHGLYNEFMSWTDEGSGITRNGTSGTYSYVVDAAFVNRPVNYVSYWDSCRFVNWLSNGQGNGDTETGTYTIPNGYDGTDGRAIQRKANWSWAVTSEDEWYKAAYYMGGNTNAGYWLYPTRSNRRPPSNNMADPSGNNANYRTGYGSYPIDSGKYTTVVGEFQNSASAYGTFDQGGNVWEWDEAIVYQDADYAYRGVRGGSFDDTYTAIWAPNRADYNPGNEGLNLGFRVSYVPEPSSIIALLGGLTGLIRLRRRTA
jgi:formylglycine-generating enzyme